MKEAFWGIFIIILGSIGIVAINLFQSLTVTTDQNYYLLKEVTRAAMNDSIDLSFYRSNSDPRTVRIVEDAFVENLTRRFAESVILSEDYKIIIHDIVEYPPKVSLSLVSSTTDLNGEKYKILLSIDSIYEGLFNNSVISKYTPNIEEEYTINNPEEKENPYKDGTCPDPNNVIDECINGDLRFEGWGDVKISSAMCKEDLDKLAALSREVNYKECRCGKWSEIEKEIVNSSPVRVGNTSKYAWVFDKKGPINNIYSTKKYDVVAGKCVESLELECPKEGLTVLIGNTKRLNPIYIPSDATNRNISWKKSNDNIVFSELVGDILYPKKDYIDITGIKVGTSNITATTTNNKSAICLINVIDPNDIKCPSTPTTIMANSSGYATLEKNLNISEMNYSLSDNSVATIDQNGLILTKDVMTEQNISYSIKIDSITKTCPLKILPITPSGGDIIEPETGECNVGDVRIDWGTAIIKSAKVCPQMFSNFKNQATDFTASNTSITVVVAQCGKRGYITSGCKGQWYRETMTFEGKTIDQIKKQVEIPIIYNYENWNKQALSCTKVTDYDTKNFDTKYVNYSLRDSSEFICKQVESLDSIDGFIDSEAKNLEVYISNITASQGLKGIRVEHKFTGDAISKCIPNLSSGQGTFTKKSNGVYTYDAPDIVKNAFDVKISCSLNTNREDVVSGVIHVVPPKECKFNIKDSSASSYLEVNKYFSKDFSVYPSNDNTFITTLIAGWSHKGVLNGSAFGTSKSYKVSGIPLYEGNITVTAVVQPQGDCIEKSADVVLKVCKPEATCMGNTYYTTLYNGKCYAESAGSDPTCSSGTKMLGTQTCLSTSNTIARECKKTTGGHEMAINSMDYFPILNTKSLSWECAEWKSCPVNYIPGNETGVFKKNTCYRKVGSTSCNGDLTLGPNNKCYSYYGYTNPKMACPQ